MPPKNLVLVLWGVAALIFLFYAFAPTYPGQVFLPVIEALLLVIGIFIYGFFFLRLFKREEQSQTQPIDLPTAFAVGLIWTTFFFFLVAFLQLLVAPIIFLYYVLPVFLLLYLLRTQRAALSQTIVLFFKRSPWTYPVFFLPFIYALLPATFYDTLVYHLGIPNLYLQQGGFMPTAQFLFANTSIYYEISLIPAVFAGELVPSLFHFCIGVIFILAATDFAVEYFQIKKPHLFILMAVSMPMSVFLLSTVKNDLLSALFILLGIRYLLHHRFALAALFWGFAIGIKYFNIVPLIIFLVVFFIKKRPFPLKKLAFFGVICAALVVPLAIKNYIYAGNPFFPFLGHLFPNPYWDASRYGAMASDVGKMFHTFKQVLEFPYTFSFHHSGFGGMVGAQFLIFLPFLLLVKERLVQKWQFLLFAMLTIYISGNFTGSVRFLYLIFILLAMYLAVVYETINSNTVKALFFLVIAFNIVTSLALQEQMCRSSRLLSGAMDVEEYKASMFPTYPAIAYVNQQPRKGNVLLVGEARNYYLNQPYFVSSGLDYSILKKYLVSSATMAEFIRLLHEDHIGYIIFNLSEFNRLQKGYNILAEPELRRMGEYFKSMQSDIVFQHQSSFVFQVR